MSDLTAKEVVEWFERQVESFSPTPCTIACFFDPHGARQFSISTFPNLTVSARGRDFEDVAARFRARIAAGELSSADKAKALRTQADLLIAEARRLEAAS